MKTAVMIIDDTPLRASAAAVAEFVLRAEAHEIPATASGSFMFMPGGLHGIVVGTGDRRNPKAVEAQVQVDRSSADVMRAQLAVIKKNFPGQRPFIDFFHENKEAGFWPEDFFWAESPRPGVYVTGEWSAAGKAKVEGKIIRAFSPEFRVDDVKKKPARLRCSEYAGLNLGGFTNTPAFRDILPLWAQHAGEPGVVNKNQNTNTMTKEQLAALKAQKLQLEQEIEAIRAQGHGPEELVEQLGTKQNDLTLLASQIEAGENALRASVAEGQLLEQRRKDAKAAVAAAVKRGAIGAKDEALMASWEKLIVEDPANITLLASAKGFQNLATVSAPASQRMIIRGDVMRESNDGVLRAMALCQARQTPDVEYGDKLKISRELSVLYANEIMPRLKEGDDIVLRGSNTLGTLAATLTSIRTLELLTISLPLLKSILTDYSSEIVSYKDTLKTRFVGIPTVQTYNEETGWPTNSDMNTTDVSITYDQYVGVPISIQAHHIAGTVRRLFDEIAPAQAYALGKNMVDYIYALITAAYTGVSAGDSATGEAVASIEASLATFGRSAVIDLGGMLDDNGNPEMGRTLILNRAYYSSLAKDQTIITMAAFAQNQIIEKGVLPDVEGFRVIKASNLPDTVISGAKLLRGFAFTKSALALATRLSADYVNALPGAGNGNLQVVTTPGGFSANQVQFVSHGSATANQRLEFIYGGSRAQVKAGALLTNP
jgi:hypothetical protein